MAQYNANVEREINAWLEEINRRVKSTIQQAVEAARKEFLFSLEDKVQTIFNSVVQDYYASYTPTFYDRNESLYNLLQTSVKGDSLRIWFDPGAITPFRSGYTGEDGLYDQVFRHGWHGGAGSGEGHPAPGRPYWRTPVPYYSHWGREADIAAISPLEDMQRRISDYEKYGIEEDLRRIVLAHLGDIRIDMS